MRENEKLLMDCPVCLSLLREDHLLGQVEAALTLQRRAEMFNTDGPDSAADAHHDCLEMLVMTRKRQARIVSRLEVHRACAHPIPA